MWQGLAPTRNEKRHLRRASFDTRMQPKSWSQQQQQQQSAGGCKSHKNSEHVKKAVEPGQEFASLELSPLLKAHRLDTLLQHHGAALHETEKLLSKVSLLEQRTPQQVRVNVLLYPHERQGEEETVSVQEELETMAPLAETLAPSLGEAVIQKWRSWQRRRHRAQAPRFILRTKLSAGEEDDLHVVFDDLCMHTLDRLRVVCDLTRHAFSEDVVEIWRQAAAAVLRREEHVAAMCEHSIESAKFKEALAKMDTLDAACLRTQNDLLAARPIVDAASFVVYGGSRSQHGGAEDAHGVGPGLLYLAKMAQDRQTWDC